MKNSVITVFILLLMPIFCFSQKQNGFFDLEWIDTSGHILMEVPENRIGESFLYAHSLTTGLGSNDIGLDRGQLGGQYVVNFYRSGNKLLLQAQNFSYRAISENQDESNAVKEAFAQSILWGFEITEKKGKAYVIDLTEFLLRDAHNVISRLKEKKQGEYAVDQTKSALYQEGILNFPENTELEAIISFSGKPTGDFVKNVAVIPSLLTIRQHHSFIQLPDSNYTPRAFHPESGYFYTRYSDYAKPIDEDIVVRSIYRHRLKKTNPNDILSEPVKPIIYYLDRGCPEPISSALLEGAAWWNQAFEAAGYKDAFQVKRMPKDAHPMDIRYNVIQWVHRSTRGWSYGSSISDPRTGEILKGHVSLGSLRVRQDYMIAEGIISNFDESSDDPRMLEMALARLRQLSAHEVGHTIGLAHNFAASYNDRASVMDYPHPYVEIKDNTKDFSNAYAVGIGEWDKRAVIYGYSSVPKDQSESEYLTSLIKQNEKDGLLFITDQNARSDDSMHPHAHLWDNGNDPIAELKRISDLRKVVLQNIGPNSLKEGTPLSELEKILVPAYLMHRYQVKAVAKIIGGVNFSYELKSSEPRKDFSPIDKARQEQALNAILETLNASFLEMPENIISSIPPPAYGYPRNRETFQGHTGAQFDYQGAAEACANHSLSLLFSPERLARIDLNQKNGMSLKDYLNKLSSHAFQSGSTTTDLMLEKLVFIHLMKLSKDHSISKSVAASAFFELTSLKDELISSKATARMAHNAYLLDLFEEFKKSPDTFELPNITEMPPGSPIGCH